MTRIRRLSTAIAAGTFAALAFTSPALAAPVNSPGAKELPVVCDGVGVAVVTPGKGMFTPGFVIGSHELLVPYRFTIEIKNATGQLISSELLTKGQAPIPSDAITCTFSESEDGFTATGTVTGVLRGAR